MLRRHCMTNRPERPSSLTPERRRRNETKTAARRSVQRSVRTRTMQDSLTGNMIPLDAQAMDEATVKAALGKLQAAQIKLQAAKDAALRSEERRVGKECRSRWS